MAISKFSRQVRGVLRGEWLKKFDEEIARQQIKEGELVRDIIKEHLKEKYERRTGKKI